MRDTGRPNDKKFRINRGKSVHERAAGKALARWPHRSGKSSLHSRQRDHRNAADPKRGERHTAVVRSGNELRRKRQQGGGCQRDSLFRHQPEEVERGSGRAAGSHQMVRSSGAAELEIRAKALPGRAVSRRQTGQYSSSIGEGVQ